ncbi:TRAP transporter small permease [Chloroflexota bacterium]
MVSSAREWARRVLVYIEETGTFVGLVIMIVAVFVQIVCRYALYIPTPSNEELARYTMIYILMLGAVETTRTKRHLRVDLLPLIVKNPRTLHIIGTIVNYLACVGMFFLATWAYDLILFSSATNRTTPSLMISYAVPQTALLMGGVWMSFYFLLHAISDTRMLIRNEIPRQP